MEHASRLALNRARDFSHAWAQIRGAERVNSVADGRHKIGDESLTASPSSSNQNPEITGASAATADAVDPSTARCARPRPWDPSTILSAPQSAASRRIASFGAPSTVLVTTLAWD
jgi:hypothetical protein